MPTVATAPPLHSPPRCCCCCCCCTDPPLLLLGCSGLLLGSLWCCCGCCWCAMLAAWAPSELRGVSLFCVRATSGGVAKAAAMLNGVRAGLVGLPLPLDTAHSPMEGWVLGGGCGG